MMLPSGNRNHSFFMKNDALMCRADLTRMPMTKSQLDVCGATQMTHLGGSVMSVMMVHP